MRYNIEYDVCKYTNNLITPSNKENPEDFNGLRGFSSG
jgi:hypothetical protein